VVFAAYKDLLSLTSALQICEQGVLPRNIEFVFVCALVEVVVALAPLDSWLLVRRTPEAEA
jgi:hypothetical protein